MGERGPFLGAEIPPAFHPFVYSGEEKMAKIRPLKDRIAEMKRKLAALEMRQKIREMQERERALRRRR